MLRNRVESVDRRISELLNEVLSLNAQESHGLRKRLLLCLSPQ